MPASGASLSGFTHRRGAGSAKNRLNGQGESPKVRKVLI